MAKTTDQDSKMKSLGSFGQGNAPILNSPPDNLAYYNGLNVAALKGDKKAHDLLRAAADKNIPEACVCYADYSNKLQKPKEAAEYYKKTLLTSTKSTEAVDEAAYMLTELAISNDDAKQAVNHCANETTGIVQATLLKEMLAVAEHKQQHQEIPGLQLRLLQNGMLTNKEAAEICASLARRAQNKDGLAEKYLRQAADSAPEQCKMTAEAQSFVAHIELSRGHEENAKTYLDKVLVNPTASDLLIKDAKESVAALNRKMQMSLLQKAVTEGFQR